MSRMQSHSDPEVSAAGDRPAGWAGSRTAAFLLAPGVDLSGGELFCALCDALRSDGVPLSRASCGLLAMHPSAFARNLVWMLGQGGREITRPHGVERTGTYLDSPVYLIHLGAEAVRRRLDIEAPQLDFPIVRELKAAGATDYVALPLRFSNGQTNYISFATDRAGGFSTADLGLVWDLLPLIAMRLELESGQRATRDLLTTYLGASAARQVLSGAIRQGQGSRLDAAIWYCDLRGFTAMADRDAPDDVIRTLDRYFDVMVTAVQGQGGEVLKFVGDGMLAIFPLSPGEGSTAAERALAAATQALDRLSELNAERARAGRGALRVGIALHCGEVVFGNIGGADRLDFTAIGRAVNEVCRVEALCARLERPLLTTAVFRHAVPKAALVSLGFHPLRGVKEPQELFAPA